MNLRMPMRLYREYIDIMIRYIGTSIVLAARLMENWSVLYRLVDRCLAFLMTVRLLRLFDLLLMVARMYARFCILALR